jgi:hypothetical protein
MRTTLCLLVGIAWCQPGLADEGTPAPGRLLSEVAVAKSMREPRIYEKLAPDLDRALHARSPAEAAAAAGFRVRDGRIQVVIEVTEGATDRVAGWLEPENARHVLTAGRLIQADVLAPTLVSLEYLDEVRSVRRPAYAVPPPEPKPHRSVDRTKTVAEQTSEGVAAMNAPVWHAEGIHGAGLRVGVIDMQYEGWDSLLGTELPPAAKVHYRTFTGESVAGVHGTACAEVIHDLVPDAELYLAEVITVVEASNAIDWLMENDVTVLSMSMNFMSGAPGDGTGPMADALDAYVAWGGVAVVGAGNARHQHWQGSFTDIDDSSWHEFADEWEINYLTPDGSTRVELVAETSLTLGLFWNEWDNPVTDLDLCLFGDFGGDSAELVECSEDIQNGGAGQLPQEVLTVTTPSDGYYGFAVTRYSGTASPEFEVFVFQGPGIPMYNVEEGSIPIPADTQSVIAAAALDAVSFELESYSSRGPTNGPNGSLSGGRIKPDLSGYANVSTASYGARAPGEYSFNGTSAACPHVAGAAALVSSGHPHWDNTQIRSYLQSQAVDKGPAGKDNDYGHGRVVLGSPPAATCSYSISPTSRSIGSGGGSGSVSVTAGSGCSWTARSNSSWLHVTGGASGSGPGTVSYSVDANSGGARTATLTIAGNTFTVSQTGGGSGGDGDHVYLVAGVAHAAGRLGSQWRSNLCVTNVSESTAHLTITYRHGSGAVSEEYSLGANRSKEWGDVAASLFGMSGASAGSVEVASDVPVLVTARTYNQSSSGTFGQYLPGADAGRALTSGQLGVLPQIKNTSSFRTNVGFVNLGTSPCTVRVRLYSASGVQLGSSVSRSANPGEWSQINDVYDVAGAGSSNLGMATVEVVSGDGPIWAYASVVDNTSNDPTTVPVFVQ